MDPIVSISSGCGAVIIVGAQGGNPRVKKMRGGIIREEMLFVFLREYKGS